MTALSAPALFPLLPLLLLQVQSLMVSQLPQRLQHGHEVMDGQGRQYPVDVDEPHKAGDMLEITGSGEVAQIPDRSAMFNSLAGGSSAINLKSYENTSGSAILYTTPKNDMDLLVDITDILAGDGLIMVTALAAQGTYLDFFGTLRNLHEPMEQTGTTLFQLKMSSDNKSVDVLQPQLTMRTSDSQTETAWDMGANSPWVGSLKRLSTSAKDRVIVDGIYLILKGFFVTPTMMYTTAYHLTKVKSYPTNFDVSLTYLNDYEFQQSITFSVIQPPKQPMTPRVQDDRLPYFTQDFTDLGVHTKRFNRSMVNPRKFIDPSVSIIWKYDLERLPNNQIRIHVDPSVPERWHRSFKHGIEAWNEAFELAGYSNNTIRAVLPSDKDWPQDYDAGDARFSIISWSIDSDYIFSMGIAKVDPRSGEILKSDILMGSAWVRAWLNDLHDMKVSQNQHLSLGYRSEQLHRASDVRPGKEVPLKTPLEAEVDSDSDEVDSDSEKADDESNSKQAAESEGEDDALKLLGDCPMSLLAMGLPRESWFEVAEAGIKDVVMHEVGHILGLRHNFKGSVGVSYECTQDIACTSKHGLTASVMDYVPMNIPSAGVEKVHLFSPVVGAYDKLVIQYGYTKVDPSEESLNGVPTPAKSLKPLLEEANKFELCIDGDYSAGRDPLCTAYDLTDEPLRYYEDQILLLQKLQKTLLDDSVAPGEPYSQFGDMVTKMLNKVFSIQDKLLHWIGGLNMSYAHRPKDGSAGRPAVTPIAAAQQRQALTLLFKLFRPHDHGLLPSADLLSKLELKDHWGDLVPLSLNLTIRNVQEQFMSSLLSPIMLEHIYLSKEHGGLSVDAFLADVIHHTLGGHQKSSPQDLDLQSFMVEKLVTQLEDSHELPESLEPKMLLAVKSALQAVDSGLRRVGKDEISTVWSRCTTGKSKICECDGRARFWDGEEWSLPIDSSGSVDCSPDVFGLTSEVPDAACECLPTPSAGAELRLHLLGLKTKLDEAAQTKLSLASVELEARSSGWKQALIHLPSAIAGPVIAILIGTST